MKRLLDFIRPLATQSWLKLLISLTFVIGISGGLFVWLAQAEGSRTMYPTGVGGNRANIEWRNSFYGNNFLRRRTLLKVYAEAGEFILVGSSAVGVGAGDIRIYDPGVVTEIPIGDEVIPGINGEPGGPDFSCENQRGGGGTGNLQGRITSRLQELAGPDTVPAGGVTNGYFPCYYQAPTTGIYHVIFFGPDGDGQDNEGPPTGEVDLTSPNNFNANQRTSVAAWDVTVRPALDSPANTRTGRLFARYLALFTGGNPQPLNSTLFVLTPDGYRYQTDLRGLDPFGFIVYGNDVGFLDTDGSPLFHDVVAPENQLNTPQGGVSLAPPTHYIFFQPPDDAAVQSLGITTAPIPPAIASIAFTGDLGGNNTLIRAGGTFTYDNNVAGTYELIISHDGVDFDPTNPGNRVLYGVLPAGTQSITWDGLDNAGNEFPVGLNYPVRIVVRAGEYHFPLLDAENSLQGGPQYTLINPPGGVCPSFNGGPANCSIAFYDDRGYTTASGVDVGTPNVILLGNNPPNPARSDPLGGFDTSTNQRAFGNGTGAGFGDKKGLDMWTYFPSEARNTTINIFAFNLLISKTDNGVTSQAGGVITHTLSYTNTGPITATGVVINETVPANSRFNAGASTPGWSCPDNSPAGTVCTYNVGTLPANGNGSVFFALTINDPLPVGAAQIDNVVTIGDDGTNGPEFPGDNSDDENTPLTTPPPSPAQGKDDDDDDDDSPPPTPTPTPAPVAVAAAPAPPPTPELPVAFLPETGLKAGGQNSLVAGGVLLLSGIVLGGSIIGLALWRRSRNKNLS
ncbi:MAG: hypothetical protein AB1801_13670 [Chloroflexota bacterium]